MDKKSLSERDSCSKYIAPISQAGWDMLKQVREEVRPNHRAWQAHSRVKPTVQTLFFTIKPICPFEAKDNKHSLGTGM